MLQEKKFYTKDHEWLRIDGNQAYIGVSKFKLTGIREIEHIGLSGFREGDIIEQGMVLLRLSYRDYVIPIHSPVTCMLLETNRMITEGDWSKIITLPDGEAWLFKVAHNNPNINHLVPERVYHERFYSHYLATH